MVALIVSQGILSFWYSLVEDSMRKAYLPFDARTLSIPSCKHQMAEGERERDGRMIVAIRSLQEHSPTGEIF